jgi:hypothetical protein
VRAQVVYFEEWQASGKSNSWIDPSVEQVHD